MNEQTARINLDNTKSEKRSEVFEKSFAEETGRRPLSETIYKKTPGEVFSLLENLDNFPKFFENLEKVELVSEGRANWYFTNWTDETAGFSVPMGVKLSENRQGMIWKSEDGAGFDYSVGIELLPAQAGRGTVVRLYVMYENMMGEIAGKIEKLFGKDAEVISKKNLLRLKAFCETGSVPTTQGQPSGRDEDQSDNMKH